MEKKQVTCSDCQPVDRRDFIKSVGGAAVAGVAASALFDPRFAHAAPTAASSAESAVGRLYESLSQQQRAEICFPFEHELRGRINANWHVTKPTIGADFYSKEQRAVIDEILRNITSEDGYKRFVQQMNEDSGGVEEYSVAIFGKPGDGKFEWEMTGRHLTMRADGNSVDKAAFGGPIVYGHGEERPSENLFHYQTKQVNEVFKALEGKQIEQALLESAPRENAVQIQGSAGKFPGLCVGEMTADQQELVRATLKVLLAPYRQEDVDEALAVIEEGGGADDLHMAFYRQGDLEEDKVWDIWRLEGPSFVWHFRGAPHVHAYINIGQKTG